MPLCVFVAYRSLVMNEVTVKVKKPPTVLNVRAAVEPLFRLTGKWFHVDGHYRFDLSSVELPADQLYDEAAMAAVAMRKMQQLRYVCKSGVPIASDIVFTFIAELERTFCGDGDPIDYTVDRLLACGHERPPRPEEHQFIASLEVLSLAGNDVQDLMQAHKGEVIILV